MNTEQIKMLLVLLAFVASLGAAWLLIYRHEEKRLRIAVFLLLVVTPLIIGLFIALKHPID